MPSTWNISPEEFHRIYIANTEAFYKAAGAELAPLLDEFLLNCALGLWKRSGGISQKHVETANQLYSKKQQAPKWMLWSLTGAVCEADSFLPPVFYWDLAEKDARRGSENSRIFIRMLTNILLYLAAVDDDVSLSEAGFITECTDKLNAVCDSMGVGKGRGALDPMDFVTNTEPGFMDKYRVQPQSSGGSAQAEKTENTPEEKPDFDELMAQLEALVGLDEVKKDVKDLVNLVKVRKLRSDKGLPVPPMSLHMVFIGNPGTGKTTVARILGGLYAAIGVLAKGQLIEVDRSGLVAGYVGQTALKTKEVISSALGGVLFIDEAYSLSSGGENDFGREAIETILKAMEDHREELIVIVAGYDEPMERFLRSNPGLESRFNKYFRFPDYKPEELLAIFKMQCDKNSYRMSEDAEKAAAQMFSRLYEDRDDNFGNGRDVRNCFEDMIVRQSNRVAAMEEPTKEDLMAVLPEDLGDLT